MNLLKVCSNVDYHTLLKINSDHYPILLTLNLNKVTFKSQFKFLKMWTLNEECYKVMEETWKVQVFGCPMFILDRKLKLLKLRLKDQNKNNFGDIQKKGSAAEIGLKEIQDEIGVIGYTDSLHDKESKAQHDLELLFLNME